MAVWNHKKGVAMVCDLCKDAPFWSETGGVDGKQACVESCPMLAMRLVKEVPAQHPLQAGLSLLDNDGYDRNLRTEHWDTFATNLDKLPTMYGRV